VRKWAVEKCQVACEENLDE
jgi:hypothetical protein